MTATDEIEQVIEELADIGGAYVVLEMKVADSAPQINPKIFSSRTPKSLLRTFQQFQGNSRGRSAALHGFAAEQFADALLHLFGGIDRVGQRKNLVRLRVAFANQALDAVGQDRRFAGACASDDEHRAMDVFDGFALAIIGDEWGGTRIELRNRHFWSAYHLRVRKIVRVRKILKMPCFGL